MLLLEIWLGLNQGIVKNKRLTNLEITKGEPVTRIA
jgi:hypothetical protein